MAMTMDSNTDFIFQKQSYLVPDRNFELFYLLSECILLFSSQHVHPHPVVTIASAITSKPTMIPRAVLVTSQLFVLGVSLIQELSFCVVGGLVVSNIMVVMDSNSGGV